MLKGPHVVAPSSWQVPHQIVQAKRPAGSMQASREMTRTACAVFSGFTWLIREDLYKRAKAGANTFIDGSPLGGIRSDGKFVPASNILKDRYLMAPASWQVPYQTVQSRRPAMSGINSLTGDTVSRNRAIADPIKVSQEFTQQRPAFETNDDPAPARRSHQPAQHGGNLATRGAHVAFDDYSISNGGQASLGRDGAAAARRQPSRQSSSQMGDVDEYPTLRQRSTHRRASIQSSAVSAQGQPGSQRRGFEEEPAEFRSQHILRLGGAPFQREPDMASSQVGGWDEFSGNSRRQHSFGADDALVQRQQSSRRAHDEFKGERSYKPAVQSGRSSVSRRTSPHHRADEEGEGEVDSQPAAQQCSGTSSQHMSMGPYRGFESRDHPGTVRCTESSFYDEDRSTRMGSREYDDGPRSSKGQAPALRGFSGDDFRTPRGQTSRRDENIDPASNIRPSSSRERFQIDAPKSSRPQSSFGGDGSWDEPTSARQQSSVTSISKAESRAADNRAAQINDLW